MYLFFDTETTGLPRNWKAPLHDLDNWPRLVQLAWILADEDLEIIRQEQTIVAPDGFVIPAEASAVHGISTEQAQQLGRPLDLVMAELADALAQATTVVAHNLNFDEKIVGAEFLRLDRLNALEPKQRICTMRSSTDYCQLPGKYGYKWPSLQELHKNLFGSSFEEAHDAAADIAATYKCFCRLHELHLV